MYTISLINFFGYELVEFYKKFKKIGISIIRSESEYTDLIIKFKPIYIIQKYYKLNKLKNIRNKLKQINDINNVINILKELNVDNSDNLLNTIYTCYLLEPPDDNELQKISELQQLYNNKLNVEEYSIMTLWCCIIYYIDNLPNIRRQKTWP